MPWFRIDDDCGDSAKIDGLSDAAFRLWALCGAWCRKRENLRYRGFVPSVALATITRRRWPRAKLARLARELVEATVGGTHEHGLWEPCEGGWRFHNWFRYQPDDGEPDEQSPERPTASAVASAASEAARRAGQRSAEVRRAMYGSAQPRTGAERQPNASPERAPNASRTPAEPPNPMPMPDPNLTPPPKDLTDPQVPAAPDPPAEPNPEAPTAAPGPACEASGGTDVAPHGEGTLAGNVAGSRNAETQQVDTLVEWSRALERDPSNAPNASERIHCHPEVMKTYLAWCDAFGLRPGPLGQWRDDRNVRAICRLYARFTPAEISDIVATAPRDPWLSGEPSERPKQISALKTDKANSLLDLARSQRDREANRKKKREKEETREMLPRVRLDFAALCAAVVGRAGMVEPTGSPRSVTASEIDLALEVASA